MTGVSICFLAIYLSAFMRMSYHYIFEDETAKIVKEMNLLYKFRSNFTLERKDVKGDVAFVDKIVTIWTVCILIIVEAFTIVPLVMNGDGPRMLPLGMWYPYNWNPSPYYEVTYFTQALAQGLMGTIYSNTDMFIICTMIFTASQFELLGWEFKNLLYDTLLEHGISKKRVLRFRESFNGKNERRGPRDFDPFDDVHRLIRSEKFNDRYLERLNELTAFHQRLLEFCATLERFFSPILLSNYSISLLYLMFITFVLVTFGDLSISVSFGLYLMTLYVDIYLPIYFGYIVTEKSGMLLNDLYESPWYVCSKRFRTNFKFVHYRAGKPVVFTIGKFAGLNLGTFIMILRRAFSFFTVLREATK